MVNIWSVVSNYRSTSKRLDISFDYGKSMLCLDFGNFVCGYCPKSVIFRDFYGSIWEKPLHELIKHALLLNFDFVGIFSNFRSTFMELFID